MKGGRGEIEGRWKKARDEERNIAIFFYLQAVN